MINYAGHKFLQLVKSDRVTAFDVVRSGIEPLSDKVPLPQSVETSDHDSLIYFVAETAIRRLLNRIHNSLYSPDNIDITVLAESAPAHNHPYLNNILALSSELNRQLEQHYSSIPLQPPIMTDPVSNDRRRILNFRYHHARHMIYRLFVLYVVSQPQQQSSTASRASSSSSPTPQQGLPPLPRIILEKCQVCIQSGEALLLAAADVLEKRSPYLWSVVDVSMQRWATPGSSLESELRIVDMLLASRYG
ncbi:hypothetical protein VMCG_02256 [Cytospora schulzeri]|uniref:Transcription factor domain-containing protein n=1 Tax=Cytospora schulzeri TaxID=448051 RepID=A0A423X1G8_9PEZI|nr:hypothetical protein VMCG_02256 [Valsa malicola]